MLTINFLKRQEEAVHALSPQEKQKLAYILPSKRLDWLAARLAGKKVTNQYLRHQQGLNLIWQDIEVHSSPHQRPRLRLAGKDMSSQLSISLSHSGGCGVAGISRVANEGVIGVDVEQIRSWNRATAQAFLTDREYSLLPPVPSPVFRSPIVTLRWCIKEAYLKAKGCGLRQHPRTLDIYLTSDLKVSRLFDRGQLQSVAVACYIVAQAYVVVSLFILP